MFDMSFTEVIGYVASAMVALSFTMRNMVRLRVVNCIGCLLFVVYGAMIASWPIILTNGFITGVNCYYLARVKRQEKAEPA